MSYYIYSLVAVLSCITLSLVIYYAIYEYNQRNTRNPNVPNKIGYSQWKEFDATDKFPSRGKCALYDFEVGRTTLDTATLDKKISRRYGPNEQCTDSNQVYAAKVKRECVQFVKGTDALVNHCYLPGVDDTAKVGDFRYVYSSNFCKDSGAKRLCRGLIAALYVDKGRILLSPTLHVDKKSKVVVPVGPRGRSFDVDSIFHLTLLNANRVPSDYGRYVEIIHKGSGRTLSPGNATPGALWRMVNRAPYFRNARGVDDLRFIYVGVPSPVQWKAFPESDQQFAEFAAKNKFNMTSLDDKQQELIVVPINPSDNDRFRITFKYLSFSPP